MKTGGKQGGGGRQVDGGGGVGLSWLTRFTKLPKDLHATRNMMDTFPRTMRLLWGIHDAIESK